MMQPDERIRKNVYENNISFLEDNIVTSGLAGTTRHGATFYLTADPTQMSESK